MVYNYIYINYRPKLLQRYRYNRFMLQLVKHYLSLIDIRASIRYVVDISTHPSIGA
jgi:hypothetical protein